MVTKTAAVKWFDTFVAANAEELIAVLEATKAIVQESGPRYRSHPEFAVSAGRHRATGRWGGDQHANSLESVARTLFLSEVDHLSQFDRAIARLRATVGEDGSDHNGN